MTPAEPLPVPERMSSARELGRVASGSVVLNMISTAATLLATVVLARVMDLAQFGIYSWVVATVYLLTVPAVLGIDRLLVRDVAIYIGRSAYGHIRGLLWRTSELALVMSALIIVATLAALLVGGGLNSLSAVALAIGLVGLPLLAFGRIAQSALMGIHHVVLAQVPDLVVRPVGLLVLVVAGLAVVRGGLDASTAVALYTASAAVSLGVAALFMRRRFGDVLRPARPQYESNRWLATAFGLALLSGGAIANGQMGVTLLGLFGTPEAAGLYAVAQRGALTVAFPLLGLGAALAPTAARLWSTGHVAELQRLVTIGTRGVVLAALPIALVFIVWGGPLLALVFGAGFAAASAPLAVLSLGQLFNAATGSCQTLLIMTGRSHLAALGIAFGLALNVILAVILIPAYQAMGAAIAASLSLVVTNSIQVVIARRDLHIDTTPLGVISVAGA